MSGTVTLAAYAKINLTLDVGEKRPDGYHELSSIMQTVSLCDEVVLSKQSAAVTLVSDHISLPTDARNLAVKAARAFFCHTGIAGGVHIALKKRIPSEAGLGGGSADAAAVLRGLNVLYGTGLSADTLCAIGAGVGSDVPFCIVGGTALVTGRGEHVEPLPPLDGIAVIRKPNVGISTAEAYRALDGLPPAGETFTALCLPFVREGNLAAICVACGNRFEALDLPRGIGDTRKALLDGGAVVAQMSGSGSAVFGLFSDPATAESAAASGGYLVRFCGNE